MKSLIEILQREDNCLSLSRIIVLLIVLIWACVTVAAFVLDKTFAHYDTLSIIAGVLFIAQICNKAVECKFLSIKGVDQK